MNQPNKLTKQQLARELGVSVRQIDVMVKREQLPPGVRSGRQLTWLPSCVAKCHALLHAAQAAWADA